MAWNADFIWEPPSVCRTGIEETLAAIGVSAAAAAPEVAAAAPPILAAGLPEVAAAAAAPAIVAPIAAAAPEAAAAAGGISTLGALGLASSVGGTVAQLAGTRQQTQATQQAAESNAQALQLKAAADQVQANQEAAFAQRQALNDRRKTELLLSRQRAVAASSGGFATDPSTLTLGADVAGQGEYNALSQLAAGQTREAALNYQSEIDRYQAGRYLSAADLASTAGLYSAAGTLFSGLGTLTSNLERERYYRRAGLYGSGGGGLFDF